MSEDNGSQAKRFATFERLSRECSRWGKYYARSLKYPDLEHVGEGWDEVVRENVTGDGFLPVDRALLSRIATAAEKAMEEMEELVRHVAVIAQDPMRQNYENRIRVMQRISEALDDRLHEIERVCGPAPKGVSEWLYQRNLRSLRTRLPSAAPYCFSKWSHNKGEVCNNEHYTASILDQEIRALGRRFLILPTKGTPLRKKYDLWRRRRVKKGAK